MRSETIPLRPVSDRDGADVENDMRERRRVGAPTPDDGKTEPEEDQSQGPARATIDRDVFRREQRRRQGSSEIALDDRTPAQLLRECDHAERGDLFMERIGRRARRWVIEQRASHRIPAARDGNSESGETDAGPPRSRARGEGDASDREIRIEERMRPRWSGASSRRFGDRDRRRDEESFDYRFAGGRRGGCPAGGLKVESRRIIAVTPFPQSAPPRT